MNRKHWILLYAGTFVLLATTVFALNLSRVKTWSAEVLTHTDLNAEFDNILDHSIANADISATAAIAGSKLDLSVPGAIGGTTPAAGAFSTLATSGKYTASGEIEGSTFDINGGTIDGITSLTAGGNLDLGAYTLTGTRFISDIATGTAPFGCSSTTKVSNLNADTLDGYNTSTSAAANVIYRCGADNYMPDDTVDTSALKTATTTVAFTAAPSSDATITGGSYLFWPQIKVSASTDIAAQVAGSADGYTTFTSTSYLSNVAGAESGSATFTLQYRYVTASGEDYWIWLLVDKNKNEILQSSAAPDHVSYGHKGDYEVVPHPFTDYHNSPLPSNLEIILVDEETTNALLEGKDRMEASEEIIDLLLDYKVTSQIKTYKPRHSGKYLAGLNGQVKHLIDTVPNYVKVKGLRELTIQEKQAKEIKESQKQQEYEAKKLAKQQAKASGKNKLKSILSNDEIEALFGE